MHTLTRTIDLEEEVATLDEKIAAVEQRIDDLMDEALAIETDPDADENALARLAAIREEVDELEERLEGVRGLQRALQRAVDGADGAENDSSGWQGSEVVVKELTAAESRSVAARVQQKADERGLGEKAAEDLRDVEFMKKAVVSTPPGAPDPAEIGTLPDRLFSWLLGRADALNSTGRLQLGNSSFRERLEQRKKEQAAADSGTSDAPEPEA